MHFITHNKILTFDEVSLMIAELKKETKLIYDLVPQTKLDILKTKMKLIGMKVIK